MGGKQLWIARPVIWSMAPTPPGSGVIDRGRPTAATRMLARHLSAPPSCPGRPQASRRRAPRPRLTGQRAYRLIAEGQPLPPLDATKAAVLGYTASCFRTYVPLSEMKVSKSERQCKQCPPSSIGIGGCERLEFCGSCSSWAGSCRRRRWLESPSSLCRTLRLHGSGSGTGDTSCRGLQEAGREGPDGRTDHGPRNGMGSSRRQAVQGHGVLREDPPACGTRLLLNQPAALDEPAKRLTEPGPRPVRGKAEDFGEAAQV